MLANLACLLVIPQAKTATFILVSIFHVKTSEPFTTRVFYCTHISQKPPWLNFTKLFVHVDCGRGLSWKRTYGFYEPLSKH